MSRLVVEGRRPQAEARWPGRDRDHRTDTEPSNLACPLLGRSSRSRRLASVGIKSGIEAASRKYAGNAGIMYRKKLPLSTVERCVDPLNRRRAPNQPASNRRREANVVPRRAVRRTAATGAAGHCRTTHATRPCSDGGCPSRCRGSGAGRWLRGSFRLRAELRRRQRGESAQPRSFQTARVSSAGARSARNGNTDVPRRATRTASAAPTRKIAFAGLTPTATPAANPASSHSVDASRSRARTISAPATSRQTIEGKSAIAVSPSACGQELLDVPIVVVLAEEGNREEGRRNPERGGLEPEQPAADPASDE